ncbi:unannotated protein [freshwater metagenome]|uniref:Unannotated protein n=1 Tax=freshwater metagenome TaxID=449393 RepID=A0A6J7QAB3_9ZZZZ
MTVHNDNLEHQASGIVHPELIGPEVDDRRNGADQPLGRRFTARARLGLGRYLLELI